MKFTNRAISLFLAIIILASVLSGCNTKVAKAEIEGQYSKDTIAEDFETLSDPRLPGYIESVVYTELLNNIDSKQYVVENVQAIYISKEYIDESAYNSESNVFFGYTLNDLNECFTEKKYVFTISLTF